RRAEDLRERDLRHAGTARRARPERHHRVVGGEHRVDADDLALPPVSEDDETPRVHELVDASQRGHEPSVQPTGRATPVCWCTARSGSRTTLPENWHGEPPTATVSLAMFSRMGRFLVPAALLLGCSTAPFPYHTARVQTARIPPPPEPVVRHSARLWLELDPGVVPSQCVTPPGKRLLCFEDVHQSLATALGHSLWTSFPEVEVLGRGDQPAPGDYRLIVSLALSAVPPGASGPGWAAHAKGSWELVRDKRALAGQAFESRSRSEEHTSELQSRENLVCRLLLEKKK